MSDRPTWMDLSKPQPRREPRGATRQAQSYVTSPISSDYWPELQQCTDLLRELIDILEGRGEEMTREKGRGK